MVLESNEGEGFFAITASRVRDGVGRIRVTNNDAGGPIERFLGELERSGEQRLSEIKGG